MGLFGLPRSLRNSSATLDAHPSDSRSHAGLNGILPTPRLDLDPAVAVARFEELATALTGTGIRYAVKANPHPALLAQLAAAGCGFDAASPAEVDAFYAAGLAAGGTDEGAAGPRGHLPGAYAGYLRDPAGNKICAYSFV